MTSQKTRATLRTVDPYKLRYVISLLAQIHVLADQAVGDRLGQPLLCLSDSVLLRAAQEEGGNEPWEFR